MVIIVIIMMVIVVIIIEMIVSVSKNPNEKKHGYEYQSLE